MCPKVSFYSVKSFDRVLGGLALSVAGGAGLYTLNSWLSSIRIMNNVSEYTFSGRTSCMRRSASEPEYDCRIHTGVDKIPIDCMAKIATIVDNANKSDDSVRGSGPDTDCYHVPCDEGSRYRAECDPLMDLLLSEESGGGEEGSHFKRVDSFVGHGGDDATSPAPAFNLLTCLYNDSMCFCSSPVPSRRQVSDDGEDEQEQDFTPPPSSPEARHSSAAVAGNELSLYSQLKQYLHKYLLLDAQ